MLLIRFCCEILRVGFILDLILVRATTTSVLVRLIIADEDCGCYYIGSRLYQLLSTYNYDYCNEDEAIIYNCLCTFLLIIE